MTRRRPIPRERLAALVALGALFVGLWVAVSRGLEEDVAAPNVPSPSTNGAARPSPAPRPASPRPAPLVRLTAAGAFDPEGDGSERDDETGLAVDGRADTAWRTERYTSFFKEGVGLVLDAGRRVRVERVVVDVPGPGARAAILLGNERDGPFTRVARAPAERQDTLRRRKAARPLRHDLDRRRPRRRRSRDRRGPGPSPRVRRAVMPRTSGP